ncbi:MAG TPA: hypothetical protein VMN81_06415 [Vicinamibacterales bacterium]|nr:hypothetical protein [Vicinamibacterales bacterium]
MAIVRAAALAVLLASPLSAEAQTPDPITIPAAPGRPIATPQDAPLMRFAPRAIVDFDVTPQVSES